MKKNKNALITMVFHFLFFFHVPSASVSIGMVVHFPPEAMNQLNTQVWIWN